MSKNKREVFKIERSAVEKVTIGMRNQEYAEYKVDMDNNMVTELLKDITNGLNKKEKVIHILVDKGERNREPKTMLAIGEEKVKIVYGDSVMDEVKIKKSDCIILIVNSIRENASEWASDYVLRSVAIINWHILDSDVDIRKNLFEAKLKGIEELCDKTETQLNSTVRNNYSRIIFNNENLEFREFTGLKPNSEITMKVENNQVIIFPGRPKRALKCHYVIKLEEYLYNHPGLITMLQEAGVNQETEFMRINNAYYMIPKTKNPKFMELSRDELMSIIENDDRISKNDLMSIEVALDFTYSIEYIINDFLLNNDTMLLEEN